jgi:hypothetical protein
MPNLATSDHLYLRLISGGRNERIASEEREARLRVRVTPTQAGIERCLVHRTRTDVLAARLPLGDHPLADAEVCSELTDAHPLGLAQCPNLYP